jgi:hypothetical protein
MQRRQRRIAQALLDKILWTGRGRGPGTLGTVCSQLLSLTGPETCQLHAKLWPFERKERTITATSEGRPSLDLPRSPNTACEEVAARNRKRSADNSVAARIRANHSWRRFTALDRWRGARNPVLCAVSSSLSKGQRLANSMQSPDPLWKRETDDDHNFQGPPPLDQPRTPNIACGLSGKTDNGAAAKLSLTRFTALDW